jgi:hypothetical protein
LQIPHLQQIVDDYDRETGIDPDVGGAQRSAQAIIATGHRRRRRRLLDGHQVPSCDPLPYDPSSVLWRHPAANGVGDHLIYIA